jgi:Tol biopolymer transport system component
VNIELTTVQLHDDGTEFVNHHTTSPTLRPDGKSIAFASTLPDGSVDHKQNTLETSSYNGSQSDINNESERNSGLGNEGGNRMNLKAKPLEDAAFMKQI